MRALDLSVGLASSVGIHLAAAIFLIGNWLSALNHRDISPQFRLGVSSVEIKLVAQQMEPEPEPVVPVEPDSPIVADQPVQKDEQEPVQSPQPDEGVKQGFENVSADVRPVYPLGAQMRGEEGRVQVRVWIDAAGRASGVEIVESSGHEALDKAALKAARNAYFRDGTGNLVYSTETTVTFRFKLVD